MIVIGVTGGVGAGKSEILRYLQTEYGSRIIMTDDYAKQIQKKGGSLYGPLCDLLAAQNKGPFLTADGEIDKAAMASMIFEDPVLLSQVNGLIHPAVLRYCSEQVQAEKERGELEFLVLESALLYEFAGKYRTLMDDLWYIYCSIDERSRRLSRSRGYSDEKIANIIKNQAPDDDFRRICDAVIDNSGSMERSKAQVDERISVLRSRGGVTDEI